ncbi:hypothetical protein [Endozoicomonas ascidiicola]|nr:hypothetical protein [Endozoicomonas ascidiicola]
MANADAVTGCNSSVTTSTMGLEEHSLSDLGASVSGAAYGFNIKKGTGADPILFSCTEQPCSGTNLDTKICERSVSYENNSENKNTCWHNFIWS